MSRRPTPHGALRSVRGVLLALSSAGLAITAHALADGGVPDTALTLMLTLLVGWIGAALAERTKGPAGVLAVLGTAQVGMHVALTGLMDHGSQAPMPLVPSPGMILAHGVATIMTALLLMRAESMLLAAAAALRFLVPVVWRPPVPAEPAPVPVRTGGDTPLVSVLLRRIHGRRGPPA